MSIADCKRARKRIIHRYRNPPKRTVAEAINAARRQALREGARKKK